MAILQFKSRPASWDTWLKSKCIASQLETQNRFNCDSVKPTRRTGVPCPAASARVWRGAIDVSTNHIGLNFVALNLLGRCGVINRVDEVPKFHGAIAETLQRRRKSDPSRGVG